MDIEVKYIDHLGIVAGICDEVLLVDRINQLIGTNDRQVSVGHAIKAMVLNALGFSDKAMYLTPKFFKHRPTELLIGQGIQAEWLNESSLGTALDLVYDSGITEVFFHTAMGICQQQQIPVHTAHLDSTTFSLYGDYLPDENDLDAQEVRITHGYSKDNNPDLKQVVLNMICANRSTLPVWIEALDGNTSDKKGFLHTIQSFKEQLGSDQKMPVMIMDSAFYSEANLLSCNDIPWITRVPETLKEVKRLYAELDHSAFVEVADGYRMSEYSSSYAEVPQRWLVIQSKKAKERELGTLEKRVAKIREKQQTQFMHLRNRGFACEADAVKAGVEFDKTLKYQTYHPSVVVKYRHDKKGRPSKGVAPTKVEYFLDGHLEDDHRQFEEMAKTKGMFIVATNQLSKEILSNEAILQMYKEQGTTVERGFRFLKYPLFFAESLYLKSPKRIMALLMVMTLSLFIYTLAEQKVRHSLQEAQTHVWNQKNKPTDRPTLRWVIQCFNGIRLIRDKDCPYLTYETKNLEEFHLRIIKALGPPFKKIYFLG